MDHASEAAARIMRERGVADPATIGIVLGSGLSTVGDNLDDAVAVPYADLPGFPASSVSGHAGRLVVGGLDGTPVAVLQGRTHYYEKGDAAAMAVPIETLVRLGCQSLILTNAAGSLHPDWYPGSLALISDHINLSGMNPLIGAQGDDRFVALMDCYDRRLRARLKRAATMASIAKLNEGVYAWFSGPSFETAAEIRMAKLLGADLVGMSTVPEAILARRLNLRVAGLSVITNFGTGLSGGNPNHGETKQVAVTGSMALRRLLKAFVRTGDTVAV